MNKTVLETQTVVELPAREMLAFLNWNLIVANQGAANSNTQLNVLGIGQANLSAQSNTNGIVVNQS